MNHSKKYIAAGVVISNLFMVFVGAFVFPWFWKVNELNQDIALVLILIISLITISSAIASYFWSHTGIALKNLRLLAIVNTSWLFLFFLYQPSFGINNASISDFLLYNFFSKACLVILLFCSLLGNWFGRRFFYE